MKSRVASLLKNKEPETNRGLLIASGTTVPADTSDGYQTGCTFAKTDGSAGTAFYINEGSVTSSDFNAVDPSPVAGPIILDGVATAAIQVTGTYSNVLDLASWTPGTSTDGSILKVGTGIGSSGALFATAGQKGMAVYMNHTAISGTFTGFRLRTSSNATSASHSVNNLLCQVSVESGKDAAVINSGFFEVIPKGTNVISTLRGLLVNLDSAASQTVSTAQMVAHLRVHTRGDETMSGTDDVLVIENEAIGGNGREVDSAIKITDASLTAGIIGYTAAMVVTASCQRVFDLGSMTVGSTTDGVIMRVGTGIGSSGLAFGTAGQRAFALYLRCTATSGTFIGMRLRSIADPASGTPNIDNLLCQASVIASKDAGVVNSGFFELVTKGTNVVGTGRCLLTNVDSAASVTYNDALINTHLRTHTRGDETMSGVDEMLRIENEAVGGNGRQMDSFIRCMEAAMSGGIKAAGYLIDAGTSTSLLATAVLRLPDDEVTAWDDATDSGDSEAGAIKVVIGSAVRYIQLYSDVPVD